MELWYRIVAFWYRLVGGRRCAYCRRRMLKVDGCIAGGTPGPQLVFPGWPALIGGGYLSTQDAAPFARCKCGALPNRFHHSGCDIEACGSCGGQLISCGCMYDEDDDESGV